MGGVISILFLGDIVGRPGRELVTKQIPALREQWQLDFVIANAENTAAGAGITGSGAVSTCAAMPSMPARSASVCGRSAGAMARPASITDRKCGLYFGKPRDASGS